MKMEVRVKRHLGTVREFWFDLAGRLSGQALVIIDAGMKTMQLPPTPSLFRGKRTPEARRGWASSCRL